MSAPWTLYRPEYKTMDRVSILNWETAPTLTEVGFHCRWGFFVADSPELVAHIHAQHYENQGRLTECDHYTPLLLAVWPTDKDGHLQRHALVDFDVQVWMAAPWHMQALRRIDEDFPLADHDLRLWTRESRPWAMYDLSPCVESLVKRVGDPAAPAHARFIVDALNTHRHIWSEWDPMDLVRRIPLPLFEAHRAMEDDARQRHRMHQEEKARKAREAYDESRVDNLLDNLLDNREMPSPCTYCGEPHDPKMVCKAWLEEKLAGRSA